MLLFYGRYQTLPDKIDAADLYGRLELKYKAPDAAESFRRVYPTVHALAAAMKHGVDLSNQDDLSGTDAEADPPKKSAKKH